MIGPGGTLLDIGCSSGWLAAPVLAKGYRQYIGVDRVIVGGDHAPSGATFVEGSVLSLPFGDESFDAACAFDVIEHLPRGSELHALREAYRVVRPGGKLYFSTPHASPLHTPLDPVWVLGHRHYRRATIQRLLEEAGLKVEGMFVAGGIAECLDHVRLLVYKHALHRDYPLISFAERLIERSHGRDHRVGMTVFAIASR